MGEFGAKKECGILEEDHMQEKGNLAGRDKLCSAEGHNKP